MKKMILAMVFGLMVSSFAEDFLPKGKQYVWSGYGTNVTASSTAAVYTLPQTNFAYGFILINTGNEDAFFVYGNSTNGFSTDKAICVPPGAAYNADSVYNCNIGRRITSIVYATTNGTFGLKLNFQ